MFIKGYTLTIDKPINEAVDAFKQNLDDMSQKGYSTSGNTVIYNSDHRLKLFTGEYKNDAWVVRPADLSDMLYRYQPKMEIQFIDKGDKTEINVKIKQIRALILFAICLIFLVGILLFAISAFVTDGDSEPFLFLLAPAFIMLADIIINARQMSNAKATLEYIYKKA